MVKCIISEHMLTKEETIKSKVKHSVYKFLKTGRPYFLIISNRIRNCSWKTMVGSKDQGLEPEMRLQITKFVLSPLSLPRGGILFIL